MKILTPVLVIVACVAAAFLWMERDQTVARSVPELAQASVSNFAYRKPLIVQPTEAGAAEMTAPTVVEADKSGVEPIGFDASVPVVPPVSVEDADCIVLSPIAEARLPDVRVRLEKTGFINRALIQPAEYFNLLVYAGPFKREKSARQLSRRLAEKDMKNYVRQTKDGRWRVELATFADKSEASRWAKTLAHEEQIENIVVSAQSSGHNNVQIVFAQLTPEENGRIRATFGSTGNASFFVCRQ